MKLAGSNRSKGRSLRVCRSRRLIISAEMISQDNLAGAAGNAGVLPAIAVVAPSLDILGGQGVQAGGLAEALRREGFEVLFIPVNPRFPPLLRALRRVPLLRTAVNQLLYIPSLHRLRHVDVVHVFSASYWSFLLAPLPAILAARLFGKRVILNYHSGEARDHLAHWGAGVHPWLRRADEIVVPSGYLQSVFARFGYRTRVIRNVVDTSSFRFRERRPLRPRLLSARNLEHHYRVDNTLQAFAIIKQAHPDACLTVAGYGSEETRLKQWVRSNALDGVHFAGRVEQEAMPALYDDADIFLNSSVIDNQPVSILEAFAAGLNVVSTPTGDIPALVQDEVTGRLVPHDEPRAMAAAVLDLLERQDQSAGMARRARAEVDNYTWPRVCLDWADVYLRESA